MPPKKKQRPEKDKKSIDRQSDIEVSDSRACHGSVNTITHSTCTPSSAANMSSPQQWYSNAEGMKDMFYLTTHSTHFIYGYMASGIWLRTILIVRKETCCRHIGYSYRLTARVILYAPSHRQDNTYNGLCYTSR